MSELIAKVRRRLTLWRARFRYEFGGAMSAREVAARQAPGVTAGDDRDLLARHLAAMPAAPVFEVRRSSDGHIRLLGRDVDFDGDWHLDPFFGVRWPRIYVGAISDLRPGTDVVLLWELNRMLFMLDHAAMFQQTRAQEHATACFELMRSWGEQNRYMVGKNWRSPMEAGIRLAVWSQSLAAIRDADLPSERQCGLIIRSVIRQAEFLAGNFSRANPPNNHLVGEAATLFAVATYWPLLRESSAWRVRAEEILDREATRQILPDGVEYEIALNYHLFALDFFLFFLYAKTVRNERPSPELLSGVERMIVAVLRLVSASGRIPRVGDDSVDEFLVLVPQHRMEAQPVSDEIQFASFVQGGYARAFAQTDWGASLLSLSESTEGRFRFGDAGLVSIRNPRGHLLVTAGPQHDQPFSQGHLHSDAGSFEFMLDGVPVVIDKGTHLYTYDAALRDHFRGAIAHNTVLVDDQDPMAYGRTFGWQNIYSGRLGELVRANGVDYTWIVRELLDKDGEMVRHTRVFVVFEGALVVADSVVPEQHQSGSFARWRFHLPFSAAAVAHSGKRIMAGDSGSPRCVIDTFCDQVEPELTSGRGNVDAMYSQRYGEADDGTLLHFRREIDSGVAAVTVFHDGAHDVHVESFDTRRAVIRLGDSVPRMALSFAPVLVEAGNHAQP